MEGQLREPLSFPAQRYAESFFRKLPVDSRFLQCTYQKFVPSSSIDGGKNKSLNSIQYNYVTKIFHIMENDSSEILT